MLSPVSAAGSSARNAARPDGVTPRCQTFPATRAGVASNPAVALITDEAREALVRLDPLWDELFPAEQARIVALLVERVDIGTGGMNVRLRMDGLAALAREMRTDEMGKAA